MVTDFTFSADGRLLALYGGNIQGGLQLWDAAEWKAVRNLDVGGVPHRMVFSPAGRIGSCFFTRGYYEAGIFDATTGEALAHSEIPGAECDDLRFTREDVLMGNDRTGLYWLSLPSGKLVRYAKTPVLAFSRDGALVAVASEDGLRIEVLERATEKIRASLRGHKKSVREGAFSDDGKLFASSDEESIRTWNAVSGEAVAIMPLTGVIRLGFSPDGRLLAVQRENVIQLFQANSGELRQTVAEEERAGAFTFRPDGKLLVTGHGQGKIRVWAAK